MRTVNFTDARNNLKAVADQVAEDHTATLITRRDAEDLVMLSASDYSAIQEMLYLLSSRANATRLNEAIEEAEATLPAGARVLGPKGVAPGRVGKPTVIIRKRGAVTTVKVKAKVKTLDAQPFHSGSAVVHSSRRSKALKAGRIYQGAVTGKGLNQSKPAAGAASKKKIKA